MSTTRIPSLLLPALLTLAGTTAQAVDNKATWTNFSRGDYRIEVVTDAATKGKMSFEPGGTLAKPGDTIPWSAGSSLKVTYSSFPNYAHFRLHIVDAKGKWGEFIADNPVVGSPTVKVVPEHKSPGIKVPVGPSAEATYNTQRVPGGLLLGKYADQWRSETNLLTDTNP